MSLSLEWVITTSFCLDLLLSICSPLSSTREKDIICPRHFNYNVFSHTRKNVNQKNASYVCQYRRGKKCNAELNFKRDKSTGNVDFDNKIRLGQHTRPCCIVNGVDPEDYDYDGKPKANEQGDDNWFRRNILTSRPEVEYQLKARYFSLFIVSPVSVRVA